MNGPVFLVALAVSTLLAVAVLLDGRRRRHLAPADAPVAALEQRTPNRETLPPPPRLLPPPLLDWHGMEHVRVGQIVAGAHSGEPWELNVLGTHILIAGSTGAGKSSWIWSILDGLGPYIKCGLAELWAIDPKSGLEVGMGLPLFTEFVYGKDWERRSGTLLSQATTRLYERAGTMVGVSRKHVPTVDDPHIVVLFDEMASINHIEDPKVRNGILRPLRHLMEQGRAVGFTVLGAIQDPRKETIGFRDLFPTRIGLRLMDGAIGDLVLPGARDAGVSCDQIPADMPGTGWVWDDWFGWLQVRAFFNDDDDVRRLAATWKRSA